MKKTLLLVAAVLALAAGATTARAATDPVAAVTADIQKLAADAKTLHAGIQADAQKIAADVQALPGATDRTAALATLKADWQKLQADRAQLLAPVQADWAQLKSDLATLFASHPDASALRTILDQVRQALAQQQADLKQALDSGHRAEKALHKHVGK